MHLPGERNTCGKLPLNTVFINSSDSAKLSIMVSTPIESPDIVTPQFMKVNLPDHTYTSLSL